MMNMQKFKDQSTNALKFAEEATITVLLAALILVLFYALLLLLTSIYQRLIIDDLFREYAENPDLIHSGLYRAFGNMLTILLGLELLHTIRIYFASNQVKIESLIVILIIALSRHVILLELNSTDPLLLLSVGLLLAFLLCAYLYISKSRINPPPD